MASFSCKMKWKEETRRKCVSTAGEAERLLNRWSWRRNWRVWETRENQEIAKALLFLHGESPWALDRCPQSTCRVREQCHLDSPFSQSRQGTLAFPFVLFLFSSSISPFLFHFLYIGQVCLNPTLWFRLPKYYNSHIPASLVLWWLNMPRQLTPNTSIRNSYAPSIYYIQSLVSVAQNQECELSCSVLTTVLWGSQEASCLRNTEDRVHSGRMDSQAHVFCVLIQDAFHCKMNWAHCGENSRLPA